MSPRQSPHRAKTRIPSSAPRHAGYECEADVLEGLEDFAYDELSARLGQRVRFGEPGRPGALRFSYAGDLPALLALHSVAAVYLVEYFDIPRPKALLGNQQIGQLSALIDTAIKLAPAGAFTSLRLSAAGEDSTVLTRLKNELAQRFGLAIAAEEGDLLLRLRRGTRDSGWEVLVRLTPRPLATRAWRVCNFPGSLNATLAHAIAVLTEPAHDDVLLNIACGSGTLLIERLALGQVKQAIGCDTDPAALDCARRNLAVAGVADRVRLEQWDAGAMPLPDASISVIVGDLPFGQLISTHRQNEEFYPRVLAEAARVARPGARMALLTHEVRLLERVATRFTTQWDVLDVLRVRSGGMTPRIVVFRRTHNSY